jgi:hypothetical protein
MDTSGVSIARDTFADATHELLRLIEVEGKMPIPEGWTADQWLEHRAAHYRQLYGHAPEVIADALDCLYGRRHDWNVPDAIVAALSHTEG